MVRFSATLIVDTAVNINQLNGHTFALSRKPWRLTHSHAHACTRTHTRANKNETPHKTDAKTVSLSNLSSGAVPCLLYAAGGRAERVEHYIRRCTITSSTFAIVLRPHWITVCLRNESVHTIRVFCTQRCIIVAASVLWKILILFTLWELTRTVYNILFWIVKKCWVFVPHLCSPCLDCRTFGELLGNKLHTSPSSNIDPRFR